LPLGWRAVGDSADIQSTAASMLGPAGARPKEYSTTPSPGRWRPAPHLPVIIGSFAGTSLWFAGNAILADLQREWGLPAEALGYTTSAVQLGFIAGTLAFAFFAFPTGSRRGSYSSSARSGRGGEPGGVSPGLGPRPRFLTGFFLAGIYPVGMKIASGWYRADLGNALGFLVGALVVGTAFPLQGPRRPLPWGGAGRRFRGGRARRRAHAVFVPTDLSRLRGKVRPRALAPPPPRFAASAFGYFGHMWAVRVLRRAFAIAVAAEGACLERPALGVLR
jgi:hypothetical protein